MRIGFFGDSIWAQKALIRLIEDNKYEVAFVVPRYQNPDLQLIEMASKHHIPVLKIKNVNDENFLEQIKRLNIDLNVSMSFDQIIKKDLIHVARRGFINCHAGALPFYRGRNILNWVLINGEQHFGVTVHYIDEGIDTGDIILQHIEPISLQDTYNDLLIKCYDICPDILIKAIHAIYDGTAERIQQSTIHPVGFYCGKRMEGDEIVKWEWTSERIYNFVRAISYPAPYAQTRLSNNQTIKIAKASLIKDAPIYIGTCGEVVGRDHRGIVVKTGDSTILIEKIVSDEGVSVHTPQFPIGCRFK
ncbi:methionyl-tRNA formyltransferase [Paenibacillus sp. TH7-28]